MRYVIIGNSAAGNAAASAIRARDPLGHVIILSHEAYPSYYRPVMPQFVDDRITFDAVFRDEPGLPPGVEVRLGTRVERIDPSNKTLSVNTGKSVAYDRLLIATGASAIRPGIPGLDGPGVYVFRDFDDAKAIKGTAQKGRRALIIGGGRVGMKAAMALRRRGLEVTVVEQESRLVPSQFDEVASEIVGRAIEEQGIRVLLNRRVVRVTRINDMPNTVVLSDGASLEPDFIVVTVGIRPNTELAKECALAVNRGIAVDNYLQTSLEHVFAAGDVVETRNLVTGEASILPGTWTNAVETGRIAGTNMAGANMEFPGAISVFNSFVLAGVPTVSIGTILPIPGDGHQVHTRRKGDEYRKLVVKDDRLVGTIMIGNVEGAGLFTSLIMRKVRIGPDLDALLSDRPPHSLLPARALSLVQGL
ncbi:MAG: FAD-dependent oxidoreductase [Thermodesulfobacteriota bacterium]